MIEDPTDMCLDYLVVVVQFLLQAYSNTSNSVEFFFPQNIHKKYD